MPIAFAKLRASIRPIANTPSSSSREYALAKTDEPLRHLGTPPRTAAVRRARLRPRRGIGGTIALLASANRG